MLIITQKLFRNYWRSAKRLIAIRVLNYHLASFPKNLDVGSDEQGEHFSQDLKIMEEGYQCRWDVHMMAHYC